MTRVTFAPVFAVYTRFIARTRQKQGQILTALLLAALTACSGGGTNSHESTGVAAPPTATTPSQPATAVIDVKEMKFSPATVTVKAGQTVQWKFADRFPHSVEGIGDVALEIHSPILLNGEWSHKFSSPGTYRYLCPLHPQMKGTVIVEP